MEWRRVCVAVVLLACIAAAVLFWMTTAPSADRFIRIKLDTSSGEVLFNTEGGKCSPEVMKGLARAEVEDLLQCQAGDWGYGSEAESVKWYRFANTNREPNGGRFFVYLFADDDDRVVGWEVRRSTPSGYSDLLFGWLGL